MSRQRWLRTRHRLQDEALARWMDRELQTFQPRPFEEIRAEMARDDDGTVGKRRSVQL